MVLKLFLFLSLFLVFGLESVHTEWGKTGHQLIAILAEDQLTPQAKKTIYELLDGNSLAEVSTYADEIKSDPRYRKYSTWHYVNFKNGHSYDHRVINPKGDLIQAIQKCIVELKNKTNSKAKRSFYLKLLIHFMGDVHQPLHVGNSLDKGGNTIRLKWFGRATNLHRIWDTAMLENNHVDTAEFIDALPRLPKGERRKIKKSNLMEWVEESHRLSQSIYANIEGKEDLGNRYYEQYFPLVQLQLLKGGMRLGKLLNQLFA